MANVGWKLDASAVCAAGAFPFGASGFWGMGLLFLLQVFADGQNLIGQRTVVVNRAVFEPLLQLFRDSQACWGAGVWGWHVGPFSINTGLVWMNNRAHMMWMSICIFEKILDDAHNPHMTDRHQAPAYPLRLPAELKAAVTKAAYVSRRSFNAEVTERLAASLNATALPRAVQDAVQREIELHGGSTEEALTRLVQAGEQRTGMVLNLTVHKGMTVQDLSTALRVLAEALPAGMEVALRPSAE